MATSPEHVMYMTGFRPPGLVVAPAQNLGVFTRRGVALVVPISHASILLADTVDVDHIVCYGRADAPNQSVAVTEAQQLPDAVVMPAVGPVEAVAAAIDRLGVRGGAIGLDESGPSFEGWMRFTERLSDMKAVQAAARLADARRVKGPYEIECLNHALRIAEEALDAVIQTIQRGMTEREAANLFAMEVLKNGGWPNPPLVGIGERTGILWPRPGDVELRSGNLVRFDMGCAYKGYFSRVARTAVLGEPSAHQESAYRAVQASLEAATAAVAPGATAGRVFELAGETLRVNGFSPGRDHVGHGIGIEPCERPELAVGSGVVLELGEVLRVDATHVENSSMGVSVSDTVLVTRSGARVLNRSHHGLVVLD